MPIPYVFSLLQAGRRLSGLQGGSTRRYCVINLCPPELPVSRFFAENASHERKPSPLPPIDVAFASIIPLTFDCELPDNGFVVPIVFKVDCGTRGNHSLGIV
ncbi:hypothetical protein TGRH88_007030 [Toxoplasma gondii]|uniref:Uncharacterized protein n=1 Tax=Toxoplasma gondii TaxID=5811 RepID=A0A7J6KE38_TOXGO|nr:hypothetical protein TGRH88_007030 [Toxoplasma gondii]